MGFFVQIRNFQFNMEKLLNRFYQNILYYSNLIRIYYQKKFIWNLVFNHIIICLFIRCLSLDINLMNTKYYIINSIIFTYSILFYHHFLAQFEPAIFKISMYSHFLTKVIMYLYYWFKCYQLASLILFIPHFQQYF